MGELSQLPNIGSTFEQHLNSCGIETLEDLEQAGAKGAFLMLKTLEFSDSKSVDCLYALEGAIQNVKKSKLSLEKKENLKAFYNKYR